MKKSNFISALCLFGLGCTFSSLASAQDVQKTAIEKKKPGETESEEVDKENPYALTVGSFQFVPDAAFTLGYDSNIFALRDYESDDTLLKVTPAVSFTSKWDRHLFKGNFGAEIGRYHQYSSEDYEDYWANMQGRFDISETSNIFGGVSHTSDHEERGTPDVVGTVPTTFDSNQVHLGFAHRAGDFKFRVGGTFETLDFDDSGLINNDDRDRDVSGLGVRVNYLYAPNHEFFIQAIRDIRDYKIKIDDDGFQRDSDGHRFAFGFITRHSNRLSTEGYLGRIYQAYEDPRFNKVDDLDANLKFKYLSSPRSRVSIVLDRSLEETTLANASSYLHSLVSIQALRQLNDRDSITASIGVGRADYQGIELEEDLFDTSIDWRRRVTPELSISLNYRLMINDSNQATVFNNAANPHYEQDYVRQQVMLTFNTALFDVVDPDFARAPSLEALVASRNDWHGFYIGGEAGHGSTHARTYGVRGTSGNEFADLGDAGTRAGVFAGIGWNKDRWYFGIEAEAERANQNIAHIKDKSISRTFNIEDKQSAALSLRGGYTVKSGALFYASVGRARAEFDTSFRINNEPLNAVDSSFNVDGARYGIGTDIPVTDSIFLRMGYSYTNYDAYVVDAVTTAEEYNASDNIFHLGVGWLVDGNGSMANVNPGVKTNGFYAGLQFGHGSLNSQLSGIHTDGGSTPGTYNFWADFGNNTGFSSGLFAGVGYSAQSTYLGLEVETEGSSAEWDHERGPTGRDFGLKKKSGIGLGLRMGYQLRNGTLLYISGSRVKTRFITSWIKGGNVSNDIERDDKVYGMRFGIGADIPTSRNVFIRTSYTFTDYEPYRFVTQHGNFDDMTFDNSETLYRLGLGVRF